MTDKPKSKKERITEYIEEYLEKFVKDEVTLTAGEIRKWPVVDKLCDNTDAPNICNAMKSVNKYRLEFIDGVDGSTSFKMQYFKEKN